MFAMMVEVDSKTNSKKSVVVPMENKLSGLSVQWFLAGVLVFVLLQTLLFPQTGPLPT